MNITGGGVSGCHVARELASRGCSTALITKDLLGGGGSAAAGAFITPLTSRSRLTSLVNDAYVYSLNHFYENHEAFRRFGLQVRESGVALPADLPDFRELMVRAGVLSIPSRFLRDLVFNFEGITIYEDLDLDHSNISYDQRSGLWVLKANARSQHEEILAERLIICSGFEVPKMLEKERYISEVIRSLWGQALILNCDLKERLTSITQVVNKFVAAPIANHRLLVASTHIRGALPSIDAITHARDALVRTVKEEFDIAEVFTITALPGGVRASFHDYFPAVGKVYNSAAVMEANPKVVHGLDLLSKASSISLPHYPQMYIQTGFSGRGYVLAPYTSKLLVDEILLGRPVPASIDPLRILQYWFRQRYAHPPQVSGGSDLRSERTRYRVFRIDFNDNRFDLETFDTLEEATSFAKMMEERMHTQWYYVEEVKS